jgi:hypothetical protein
VFSLTGSLALRRVKPTKTEITAATKNGIIPMWTVELPMKDICPEVSARYPSNSGPAMKPMSLIIRYRLMDNSSLSGGETSVTNAAIGPEKANY